MGRGISIVMQSVGSSEITIRQTFQSAFKNILITSSSRGNNMVESYINKYNRAEGALQKSAADTIV